MSELQHALRTPQRRALGDTSPEMPKSVERILGSPGRALDIDTRATMESRFGRSFADVRVHTDSHAAESAREMDAAAFTAGAHIVFGANRFDPRMASGRHLLAHELTHVAQQRNGAAFAEGVGRADDVHEREADRVANTLLTDTPLPAIASSTEPMIRRQPAAKTEKPPDVKDCLADHPENCATYEKWVATIPTTSGTDVDITASLPKELRDVVTGASLSRGQLPDCADVSMILRHYYLKAKGQSFSFLVGRNRETADTYTLGSGATNAKLSKCLINAGTESFQETRKDFALVNFYKTKGKPTTNLRSLVNAGLSPGDLFVWKRLAGITGNFQGHAQTVQKVVDAEYDKSTPPKVTKTGTIVVVQGNMSGGRGVGQLQQRISTFTDLTGKDDGDADILPKAEESFFGAGPWKG